MTSKVVTKAVAINHINEEVIASNVELFKKDFAYLDLPICCVLVGGKSKNYIFRIRHGCVERVYRDFRVLHQQWYRCNDDDF